MKLTPLDIQQQKFQVKFRGYDKQEVETFLEMISADVESLMQESNTVKVELQKCEGQLVDFRENERAIQQTIMTTQKISDDLKRNAQREAELIISEAKVAAGKIMNDARAQAEKVMGDSRVEVGNLTRELNDLKNRKMEYELSFKSLLESQLRLLEPASGKSEQLAPDLFLENRGGGRVAVCLREKDGDVIVKVVLQPRASRDEVVEQQGDCLKMRVTAPPVDNQANTKLCELLAKLLGIGKKQVTVIGGHKARIKQVRVANSTVKEVRKKLIPDH